MSNKRKAVAPAPGIQYDSMEEALKRLKIRLEQARITCMALDNIDPNSNQQIHNQLIK